jgi:putative ABC transport system permease protein
MARVPIARRTLFIERRRAALGVGGVALALLIVLALGAVFDGTMREVTRYIDTADADVFVAQSGVRNMHMSLSALSDEALADVRSIDGVERADPILYETSPLSVGDARQLSYLIGYHAGRPGGPVEITKGEEPGPDEIVLDAGAADKLGVDMGDEVSAMGRPWTVSGLTEGMTNITNTISYMRFADFANAREMQRTISYILVSTSDPQTISTSITHQTGLEALTNEEFSGQERRIVQDMSADIMRIMTVSGLLIGLTVVVLVLYSATLSRLRDIGLMKAIGASNQRVAGLVLVQAAWTVVPALALALLTTLGLSVVMSGIGAGIPMWLSPAAVARVGAIALLLGAAGAIAPLSRVVRVEPTSVFRR